MRKGMGRAAAGRPPLPVAERPQQLPGVRAPHGARPRPRARASSTLSQAAAAGRRADRRARPRARGRLPRGARGGRPRRGADRAGRRRRGRHARRRCAPGAASSTRPRSGAGDWRGYADFLLRVEEPSELGEFSYEAGRRQARHPPEAVLHLPAALLHRPDRGACRAGMPERMHVVLGTNEQRSFRPRDFLAYADRVQRAVPGDAEGVPRRRAAAVPVSRSSTATTATGGRAAATCAAPTTTCASSRSSRARRRSSSRTRACGPSGSSRRSTAERAVPRISRATLAGLRQQARLQVASRGLRPPAARAAATRARPRLRPAAGAVARRRVLRHRGRSVLGRGRARVPARLADARRRGLHAAYKALWAHDRARGASGVRALGRLDDRAARARARPAHLPLQPLRADRDQEADGALRDARGRGRRAAAPQGVRRPLHGRPAGDADRRRELLAQGRRGDVPARARRRGDRGRRLDPRLPGLARHPRRTTGCDAIEDYNADDCRSTLGLRDWLLERARRGRRAVRGRARRSPLSDARARARWPRRTALEAALVG